MNSENENKPVLYPEGEEVTFFMPNTNTLGVLKDAKKTAKLTSKYMTVDDWKELKGIEQNFFFLGFKPGEGSDGKPYMMAKLVGENGPIVAAQTILVQSLGSVEEGQGVSIVCTDVVKNAKNGKTVLFDVVRLDVNIFKNKNNG